MDRTLLDKLWDQHVVSDLGDGWSLLHIDRHLLHDLSGTAGLFALAQKKLSVRNPELAFATLDHAVSSAPGRTGRTFGPGAKLWAGLKQLSNDAGIRYFELGQTGPGHCSRHGARARHHAARRLADLWRQPHLHQRRSRGTGLRRWIVRTHSCAGDADTTATQAPGDAGPVRRQTRTGCNTERPDPASGCQARRCCRDGVRNRVCG